MQYAEALRRLGLPTKLARFDPRVAGTPPLGLDLPGSDIDLLCHAPDAELFTQAVWDACAHFDGFAIRQWSGRERPVIATFAAETWDFEIFGHVRPVAEQVGWRHFRVERRLLELAGPGLRAAVLRARLRGLKTEPAFAQVLALPGDPYRALLALSGWRDEELAALLTRRGFLAGPGAAIRSRPGSGCG